MISELVSRISSLVIRENEKTRKDKMKRKSSLEFGRVMRKQVQSGEITQEESSMRINRAKNWVDPYQAHIGYYKGSMDHIAEMSNLKTSSRPIQPPLESISSLAPINPQS